MHQQTSNCHHPTCSWQRGHLRTLQHKHGPHPNHDWPTPLPVLVKCFNLSWHPLSQTLKSHSLLPTALINSTAPMPTLCTSKPPNRPAH
jgi:hypothetical protein